jgi:hypothetical protein
MPKAPTELTTEAIKELSRLSAIGGETIRNLIFTLERREKKAFIAGFRYYRAHVAQSAHPYDDIAQMAVEKGFEEFLAERGTP